MDKKGYTKLVEKQILEGIRHSRVKLQNLAKTFGISDKTIVKELTELAIVNAAKKIAKENNIKEGFIKIVEVYNRQMNMSFRTSMSILLQQYSTPAPIGFLMGYYCGLQYGKTFLEPSAGNGLLTILGDPKKGFVNELDKIRFSNLKTMGYAYCGNQDASIPFLSPIKGKTFDAVVSNPPFGKLPNKNKYNGFPISDLDHWMVLNSLNYLKSNGKAAFIIGGHTKYDDLGRIKRGKNSYFLHALYRYFNVEDVIPLDGHKLYSRQGTAFDTRLILINGKKDNPIGQAPLKSKELETPITDFNHLFNRVDNHLKHCSRKKKAIAIANALKLKLKLNQINS